MTRIRITVALLVFLISPNLIFSLGVHAKGDDFKSVVKMIEQFYGVKHEGIPFLGKAAMKVARTAARVRGGSAKRIAEAGSIQVAIFEDQTFAGELAKFRATLNAALQETWSPLIQTISATADEQVYLFLRDLGKDGKKVQVLVVTIEARNATVVQATLSPKNFALLLKDPEGTGRSITEEATIIDQE